MIDRLKPWSERRPDPTQLNWLSRVERSDHFYDSTQLNWTETVFCAKWSGLYGNAQKRFSSRPNNQSITAKNNSRSYFASNIGRPL